jgi:hypothetical protein
MAPRDIVPGAEWGAAMVQAIDQCRVMVLVFSTQANASPQIRREVQTAVSRGVPVVPMRIEDIKPTASLSFFIDSVHWLDALTPPLERHWLHRMIIGVEQYAVAIMTTLSLRI